jgi:hypothetical protein
VSYLRAQDDRHAIPTLFDIVDLAGTEAAD